MPEPLTGPAGHDMTSARRRVLVLSSRDWDRSDAAVRETAENRRIISEATLRLTVNGSDLAHLLCLRQAPVELALGHLLTEGLVSGVPWRKNDEDPDMDGEKREARKLEPFEMKLEAEAAPALIHRKYRLGVKDLEEHGFSAN